MQGITPCLWFDAEAEQAAELYTSIFPDSEIGEVVRYTEAGPGEPGSVLTVSFRLNGHPFMALNGGPVFTFSEATSFVVNCETQEEVDYFWERLSEGGEKSQCGWLKDRYGMSWQVVPTVLDALMADPDPEKARRVTEAMLQMTRLDIAALRAAYEGG